MWRAGWDGSWVDGYAMRWVNADDQSDKARFGKSFFAFLFCLVGGWMMGRV